MGKFAQMQDCVFPRVCACSVLVGMRVCHRCECACAGAHRGWSLHRHAQQEGQWRCDEVAPCQAGKTGNGVISRCHGGGGGLYYFLVGNGELGKDRALRRGMAQAGVNNTEATSAPKENHVNFLKAKLQELHPLRFSKWPWTDPFLAPGSQE